MAFHPDYASYARYSQDDDMFAKRRPAVIVTLKILSSRCANCVTIPVIIIMSTCNHYY